MLHNKRNYYKSGEKYSITHKLILGGILSFLGLDEDSKIERKYEREVENAKDEDFDEKLRNILRPAILNMQVGDLN